MALSTQYNCHIICILHTNPGTDKARGHVGSALQRKAESVIYVHKVDDISIVEPQFCRNEPFERFAFRVNDEGIPYLTDLPLQSGDANGMVVEILSTYFGGNVDRKVLTNKIVELQGVSADTARMRIARAIKSGTIIQEGNIVRLASVPVVTVVPEPMVVESQSVITYDDCPRCFTDMEDELPYLRERTTERTNAAFEPSGVVVAHRRCKRRLLKWELAHRFSTRLLGIYAATDTSEA